MGKIGDRIIEKSQDIDGMARARYVTHIARELGISMGEAIEECTEGNNPIITLGYKTCTPTVQMGLFAMGRKTRERMIRLVEMELTPEELELFRAEILPAEVAKQFRQRLRAKG